MNDFGAVHEGNSWQNPQMGFAEKALGFFLKGFSFKKFKGKSPAELLAGLEFTLDGIPKAFSYLEKQTGIEMKIDPFVHTDANAWTITANWLSSIGLFRFSLDFYLRYLEICYEIQAREKKRIHKGAVYFWISMLFEQTGQIDLALSYMLLAFVEDISTYPDPENAPAYARLVSVYGFSRRTLVDLMAYGKKLDKVPLWPEMMIMGYESKRRFLRLRLPFNPAIVKEYCHILSAKTRDRSGKTLELFIAYLFQTRPGVSVEHRKIGRGEYDIIVRYDKGEAPIFPFHQEYIIVECKDRERGVDLQQISNLISKLSFAKTNIGIMVSRRGLTGRGKGKNAEKFRDLIFTQSGIVILDITIDELCPLDTSDSFHDLLLAKYEEVRLDVRSKAS